MNAEFMSMARRSQLINDDAENEAKRIEGTKKKVLEHIKEHLIKKKYDQIADIINKDDSCGICICEFKTENDE